MNGAKVRTYGQTFGTPEQTEIDVGKDKDAVNYGHDSYSTYKIVFHEQIASNYSTSGNSNNYYVGYDTTKSNQILDIADDESSDSLISALQVKGTYITGNNTSIYSSGYSSDKTLSYTRPSNDFYLIEERIAKSYSDPNETKTISDWYISANIIKSIKEKFNLYNENNYVYFSLPSKSGSGVWDTAYKMIENMADVGRWDPANYGKKTYFIRGFEDQLDLEPGKTALNLFDNQLYLSTEFLQPQEIYIRHIDEKGNLLNIANASEVLVNSSGESIKNNGENKNSHTEYQEYYKINLGEQLRVSRSLKMAIDGKLYKYKKAIVSIGKTFNDAKKNDNINTNSNSKTSSTFNVGGADTNKAVTIVTFIYSEGDAPGYPSDDTDDDDLPEGDIHTEYSSDPDNKDCIQKYTPTNENVTPYLSANKTLLKDLVYKLEKNGDRVVYKMSSFNVQKLDGGKVYDNVDKYPETGKIFGEELYTLFASSDSSRSLTIKEFSLDEANKFRDEYNKGSLPSQSVIDNFVKNQSKSQYSDFDLENNKYFIPKKKYNGLRNPKLSAHYKAVDVLNNYDTTGGLGYIDAKNEVNVIVYNPLDLDKVNVTSKEIINHTTSSSSDTNVIQKNAEFKVTFGTSASTHYSNITDTLKYLDHYYLFFDIDIVLKSNYQIKERTNTGFSALKTASAGSTVTAGTLIKINKDNKEFTAIASSNKEGEDIVSQIQNNVVLIGVTNNMPSIDLENLIFTNAVKKYVVKNETIEQKYINITESRNIIPFNNHCAEGDEELKSYHEGYTSRKMYEDAYYFAMARAQTSNVGRIYDFKITDCSDIDYKSVFRKSSNTGNINDLTGVQYFSGVKLFNIYTNEINTLEERANLNISNNSTAKKIIPLGPYKNTNTSYISAPKMGYRISFDLKTSGYYDKKGTSTREISIKPSYYYISKDGKKFVNNINLYYKNSSGKYINFTGSDYTIYFKPKDGYRSVANSYTAGNISNMSDQLEPLVVGSTSGFTLNSKMMSTADNNFIQAWYGEFKLPNSTIAVEGNNISKPLTDGYIGVKFEIKSVDKDSNENIIREISYNQDNQNTDKKTNTTQWDYEGFLGFTNYGNEVDKITLQLEKGNWEINNSIYQSIKGSVVLFDTDNRAANDFD